MKNWKEKLEETLAAGQKPSYDLLEEALAGALEERKEFASQLNEATEKNSVYSDAMQDMTLWLGTMVEAFMRGDANKLAETMNDFVNKRVKVVVHDGMKNTH